MYGQQSGCGAFLWIGTHELSSFPGLLPTSASGVSGLLVISADDQNQLYANTSQSAAFTCHDYKL